MPSIIIRQHLEQQRANAKRERHAQEDQERRAAEIAELKAELAKSEAMKESSRTGRATAAAAGGSNGAKKEKARREQTDGQS